MLLAASSSAEFCDEVDEALASTVSASLSADDRGAVRAKAFGETSVGGLRSGVADAEWEWPGAGRWCSGLVWSATSDEVSAASFMSNWLRVWRLVATAVRKLSEAKMRSWQ